jgi:hypothetical protein
MTTFDSGGHEDLRQAIIDRWTHLALVDSSGNEETRISISGDARAQWTQGAGSNPITVSCTVKGGDSDISTPFTVLRAELYTSSSDTTRRAHDDTSTPRPTLEASEDEVTITIDVEHPNV